MFQKNIKFKGKRPLSFWRRVSFASWSVTKDSSVQAFLECDATEGLKYLEEINRDSEVKVTLTHLAGRALAEIFDRHPEINGMIRLGAFYQRETADICFLVASGESGTRNGEDLSGLVVRECNLKSLKQIAIELKKPVRAIKKNHKDFSFRGIKRVVGIFPLFVRKKLVSLTDLFTNTFNLWFSGLGIAQDAFGSAMLTSVISLDLDCVIARIYPPSRNACITSIGAVRQKPVVRKGQIVIAPIVQVVFTADHRIVDGLHASYMLKTFREVFENPRAHDKVLSNDSK